MRPVTILISIFMLCATLAHSGCAPRSRGGADEYARRLRHMVGSPVGPLELQSIEPEGNMLVFTFDGPKGWRAGTPSYSITAFFLEGFCRSAEGNGYLAAGRTLRVDTFESGESLIRGTPVTRCPHP
jgi:hypothetical protein